MINNNKQFLKIIVFSSLGGLSFTYDESTQKYGYIAEVEGADTFFPFNTSNFEIYPAQRRDTYRNTWNSFTFNSGSHEKMLFVLTGDRDTVSGRINGINLANVDSILLYTVIDTEKNTNYTVEGYWSNSAATYTVALVCIAFGL